MAAHPDQKRLRLLEGFVEPDRGTKTGLLSLPQEILSAIFRLRVSDVDDPVYGCNSRCNDSLAPLCLVCTTFAELVRPIMMERVYFSRYQQVEAFTKMLAEEGERVGARVRHVGIYGIVKTRTKSGKSDRIKHEEFARLLALVPNITTLAIGEVPVNVSSIHGSLVRALSSSRNLTSLAILQHTKAGATKSDTLLRRVLSSPSSSLRRLEVADYYYNHDITNLFQSSTHCTSARYQITSLNVTFHTSDAGRVGRILDFAGSLETLVLSRWHVDDIEKLFEVPEVWKTLRSLSLLSARRRTGRIGEGQIIGLLPASPYLALDAIQFGIPSLVNLKSSPVRIAFKYEFDPFDESAKPTEIDVVESLRIPDDPRFLKLKGLEVPLEWMVEPFEMGMTTRGVSLAALEKYIFDDDGMDRAVVNFASEE